MDKFLIKGPCKVKGTVNISGSKNASLPILAASILFDEMVEIKNLPNVRDIDTMLSLIKSLGFNVKQNKNSNSVVIKKSKKINTFASYSLVKTMRAGILVLGPLITKFGKAKTSLPGGCLIGARPINYHLNALKKLGMNYKIDLIFTNAEFEDSVVVEGQPHYENCEGCDAPCESKCPMGCKMDFDLVDWEKCANFVDVPEAFKNLDTICRICQEECPYSEDLRKEILSIDVNYGGRINA